MSNHVARTMPWSDYILLVLASILVVLVTIGLATAGVFDSEQDPTCPNYGEVPALIDGGYECIPWEVQP